MYECCAMHVWSHGVMMVTFISNTLHGSVHWYVLVFII